MANPTIDNSKILYYGLQAAYDALETKDSDILYFCTDSKKIFKGSVEMTEQVRFAATKSGVASPVSGKLYIFADTGTVEVYNGSAWTVVSYPILKSIAGGEAGITASSTDVQVPSAKAVYDYVQGIIGGDDVVTNVTADTDAATIVVTKGDGSTSDVVVPGVVTTPSYDAETRTFTFPISDDAEHPVVIELGKDIFIDPDANNRYENGNIYLYLNDGTSTTNPTELVIPVTALVTDYFGDDTNTISVNVDNTTHKVTADVRVRPDGDGFNNLIKVSSTTGAVGLYFDRTQLDLNTSAIETLNGADSVTGSVAYAVKQLADGAVATNTAAIGVLNGDASTTGSVAHAVKELADGAVAANTAAIATNTAAIETLNGADSVTGSVAHAVKELADGAVATNAAAIATLNGDSTVTGSVDQKVKVVSDAVAALENNKVDVNAANIQVLATAQGWGTF